MHSVFFIAIRRLRAPLILIICIFAFATAGLSLIPGVDAEGRPWRMSVFQAFYFVTYTATTIGFGEVPNTFTDRQRLFVVLIIYLSVLGWAYLLGSLLGLTQDKGFQQAIVGARFRRSIRRLKEPFYLVCGLGETGLVVARSLDRLGHRFVAIDRDEMRVQELEVQELVSDAPSLASDASSPETLATAGLRKPECQGVLALCNDDRTNLAVAIAARLLRPELPVIGRADTPAVAASMTSLGTYQVINPYQEFGEYLALAMKAPDSHRLFSWLTGPPGSYLPPRIPAPPGHWIVCGYGRFGTEVVDAILRGGFDATVIDPAAAPCEGVEWIKGLGTDTEVLQAAGGAEASGIVAGTDDDTANLAIAVAARALNPGIFVILRQNRQANKLLFDAFGANLTMVASQIIANECLAVLRTPLLAEFLKLIRARDDAWAHDLVERLRAIVGDETPHFWSFAVDEVQAPGLLDVMSRHEPPPSLADLLRNASHRDARLPGMTLLAMRREKMIELPGETMEVRPGDRLLMAGRALAAQSQKLMLCNANVAAYVIANRDETGGWVWRALSRITPP